MDDLSDSRPSGRSPRARTVVRALGAFGLLAATALGATACSSDPSEDGGAPTRDSLAEDWEIVLPADVDGYLATEVDQTEGHVAFGVAAEDLDPMLEASDLAVVDGRRVVTHASPLWDLNPEGDIAGVTDEVGAGTRSVEVITDGDNTTFRAVLTRASD